MFQGIGGFHSLHLFATEQTEGTARGREQDFFYGVIALAHNGLEDSGVFGIDWQDGYAVLLRQLTNQFAGHNERFLVGQTDLLTGLDGTDGWLQASETDHGREHHVNGFSLNNLAQGIAAGIDFNVGFVAEECLQGLVVCVVGNNHSGWMKFLGLLGQQLYLIVGREAVHLVAIGVLFNNVEGLSAY